MGRGSDTVEPSPAAGRSVTDPERSAGGVGTWLGFDVAVLAVALLHALVFAPVVLSALFRPRMVVPNLWLGHAAMISETFRDPLSPNQPHFGWHLASRVVDVVLPGADGDEIVATTMIAGQYFGEVELRRGGHNIATIRADAVSGVEVAALDRAEFEQLLAESAATRAAIDQIVAARLAENQAHRGQGGNHHA